MTFQSCRRIYHKGDGRFLSAVSGLDIFLWYNGGMNAERKDIEVVGGNIRRGDCYLLSKRSIVKSRGGRNGND